SGGQRNVMVGGESKAGPLDQGCVSPNSGVPYATLPCAERRRRTSCGYRWARQVVRNVGSGLGWVGSVAMSTATGRLMTRFVAQDPVNSYKGIRQIGPCKTLFGDAFGSPRLGISG